MKLALKIFFIVSPLLSIYGLLLLGLYFNQEMMIFPGHKNQHTPKKYQPYELLQKVDGAMLHGWLLRPNSDHLLIYFGGNAEDISQNLNFFNTFNNYTVVMFHYRGYGKSSGAPAQDLIYRDALALYDMMLKRHPRKKIVLFGRSLGSGVATYVASKRQTTGVILSTPYDSIAGVAQKKFPFIPIGLLIKHPFHSIDFAKKITVPVLMLIGKEDKVIPYKHSKRLKNAIKDPRWIEFPDRGHNDLHLEPVYEAEVINFLKN